MKKIRIRLNSNDLDGVIKYLDNYKKSLPDKCRQFVERLGDVGISTARAHLGFMNDLGFVGSVVVFHKEVNPSQYGCTGLVVMEDSMPLIKSWIGVVGEGANKREIIKTAQVSATLMYEFGSGIYADASKADLVNAMVEVGRGTFPSQNNQPVGNVNHADKNNNKWESWVWKDLDGTWKRSRGIKPTQPMYNAWLEMTQEITNIAKEVFQF